MLPTKGRLKTGIKNAHQHCCHGICKTSGRRIKDQNVFFIAFAQPCCVFKNNEIAKILGNEIKKHDVSRCEKCSKCLRWIQLCRRNDKNLQNLKDITKSTFICSLHFINPDRVLGPTPENPDPIAANKSKAEIEKIFKNQRKRVLNRSASTSTISRKRLRKLEIPVNVEVSSSISNPLDQRTETPETNVIDLHILVVEEEAAGTEKIDKNVEMLTLEAVTKEYSISGWFSNCENNIASFFKINKNRQILMEVVIRKATENFLYSVRILGKEVEENKTMTMLADFKNILNEYSKLKVCIGISDLKYIDDFIAKKKANGFYCNIDNSVHANRCTLLTDGDRCIQCIKLNCQLKKQIADKKMHPHCNNRYLKEDALLLKLKLMSLQLKKTRINCDRWRKRAKELKKTSHNASANEKDDLYQILDSSLINFDTDDFEQ